VGPVNTAAEKLWLTAEALNTPQQSSSSSMLVIRT
jgi:hypothetical protein